MAEQETDAILAARRLLQGPAVITDAGDWADRLLEQGIETWGPQLEMFRAAAARFRDAGQLDGVTPFGWFLAGMAAVDLGAPFESEP